MAVINRYSNTIKGAVIMTGNTLGLAQGGGSVTATSNFTTGTVTPPAGGTTTTFTSNSSQGNLALPSGAVVQYAELNWGGNASTSNAVVPFNNAIQLTTPLNQTFTITTNAATSQIAGTPAVGSFSWYNQSVDVTSIVSGGGAGFYRAAAVPGIIGDAGVGWCLIVVYQHASEPYRNINVWALNDRNPVTVSITGFVTAPVGPVGGRLIVAANGGQPSATGESMFFGPTVSNLVTLSGPNNAATNFFASQINNINGNLDTTGTWGTANATPGALPAVGVRLNYDLTRVDVSQGLTNNQTSAVIQLSAGGDVVLLNALGLQIDVNSPNLTPVIKTVDRGYADIGDTLTYTISFSNLGTNNALNLVMIDTIPNGTSFVTDSVRVDGVKRVGVNPQSGVSVGTVTINQRVTVTFDVKVITLPTPYTIPNSSYLGYKFSPGGTAALLNGSDTSNTVITTVNHVDLVSTKAVDKNYANVGDTLDYTIVLRNTGNTTANSIIFLDTIPSGTSFITGTFFQDSTPITGTPNAPGVTLPNGIVAGGVTTIVFKVKVGTIPIPNPILNTASSTFKYSVIPTIPNAASGNSNTNQVFTQINTATITNPTKQVNKQYASCGDTLLYTILFTNTGNTTALNVVLKDTIPSGTTLVANSVTINDVIQPGANPNTGILIGTVSAGAVTKVTFTVRVQC